MFRPGSWGTVKKLGSSAASTSRSSARPPRRSTCSRPSGRMADAGDRACAMEASLARAQPQPRRRDPLRGRGVHQPDHADMTTSSPSAGGRRRASRAPGHQHRSILRGQARGRVRGDHVLRPPVRPAGDRTFAMPVSPRAFASPPPTGRSRLSCRCQVASTSRTRSVPSPRLASASASASATRSRRSPMPSASPAASSPVVEGQPFAVLVDYGAHPGLARERALVSPRQITRPPPPPDPRFGCGGDRDREKVFYGRAPTHRFAHLAVITSDKRPREYPEVIIAEIREGMGHGGLRIEIQPPPPGGDRVALAAAEPREARSRSRGQGPRAGPGIRRHGRKIPFDDRDVSREELLALATVNQGLPK